MSAPGFRAFQAIGDDELVGLISATKRRLVFVAPGVSKAVSDALAAIWRTLPNAVSIILDVDPTICRLGYGTVDGLEQLQQTATEIGAALCHEPGIRIGVVITDNTTILYSPTPLLIEENAAETAKNHQILPSNRRPNAVVLNTVPDEIAKDVGLAGIDERAVGLDHVPPERVAEVKADLEANPPAKFDLARKLLVFTQRFQFVEFKLQECFISEKTVRIPNDLLGLLREGDLQQLEERVATTFKLIGKTDLQFAVETEPGKPKLKVSEKILRRTKNELIKRYLTHLAEYGTVIHKANKSAFEKHVGELQQLVTAFQAGVRQNVQKILDQNREEVVKWLFPLIEHNPPSSLTKVHGPSPGKRVIKSYLIDTLTKVFGTADDLVSNMAVRLTYKDVTWEALNDEEFIEIARKAMPTLETLFDQFKVIEAKDSDQSKPELTR